MSWWLAVVVAFAAGIPVGVLMADYSARKAQSHPPL